MIAYFIYKTNSTDKNTTIKKFMPLRTDGEDAEIKEKTTTPEERQAMSEAAFQRLAFVQGMMKKNN